ncbi:MAG: ABC transporter permease [Planctomycetota bacterium]|jgi:ABC-type lipoprotein release transport system permease subunit
MRKRKIVLLSVAAVSLSVALLVVVASLFGGFIDAIEKTGQEVFGDVYLYPRAPVPEHGVLLERLESLPDVEAATAVLRTYGLLHLDRGDVRGVNILGIDLRTYPKGTSFKESLLKQKDVPGPLSFEMAEYPSERGGFVGIGVLGKPDEETDEYDIEQIKERLGEDVVLTTGVAIDEEAGEGASKRLRRRVLSFRVADIVFTGMFLLDSQSVYLPIEHVRELKRNAAGRSGHPFEEIQIRVAEKAKPQLVLKSVRTVWEDFAAEYLPNYSSSNLFLGTSKEVQEWFVAELRKQVAILMLIFGVISSVGVLLIFCIFYMVVMTKQTDIAIVKSCGTTSWSVALLFTGFGACVGIVGSGLGAAIGLIVTKNINTIEEWIRIAFGLKLWKSSTYIFERIPNQLDISATWRIIVFATIAATVGALVPAIVAARTKPVEILRYE